jgi:hypothetical protein
MVAPAAEAEMGKQVAAEVLQHQVAAVVPVAMEVQQLAEWVLTQTFQVQYLCMAAAVPVQMEIQVAHLQVAEPTAIHQQPTEVVVDHKPLQALVQEVRVRQVL